MTKGYELYVAAARDPKILTDYGRGTADDWPECNLNSRFPKVGISLFVVLQLIVFGVPAVTMVAVQLIAQPLFADGVINGLGHRVGYRSYELPTAALTVMPWGVLIGGEELHNNHHTFPSSPALPYRPGRWTWVGYSSVCFVRLVSHASASWRRRQRSSVTAPV